MYADVIYRSTMVWAIDLDDGSLIDSLGANMGRKKKEPSPEALLSGATDLGTGRAPSDEL